MNVRGKNVGWGERCVSHVMLYVCTEEDTGSKCRDQDEWINVNGDVILGWGSGTCMREECARCMVFA